MNRLAEQTFAKLLDEVARAAPAPGGGSSAACASALAAALVEMAALLGRGRDGDALAGAPERARELRRRALALAEEELGSYLPVLEATRLPRDDPERPARLERALAEASRAPLAITETAAETAKLGADVARASTPSVRGDAVTGTLLAEAAAAAAASLVEINLESSPQDTQLEHARAARRRAAEARATVSRRRP